MMFSLDLPGPVRRALRWDATSALLGGLYLGGIFPFLGVIARRDLHASAALIACLSAAPSLGNLFAPLTAHHMRTRPKLPYVVWPSVAGRAMFFAMPLAASAPVFIALAALASAVSAFGAPAYAAVIRDAYPVERRGLLMGLVRVAQVVTSMVGALLIGQLLGVVSYRWIFPAVAALGIGSTLAFSRIGVTAEPGDRGQAPARFSDGFRLLAVDRTFRLYSACFFLYGLGNLIMGPVIPVFQVDELHISTQWVGYLATAATALGALGYLVWGRLLDRHGPFRLLLSVIAVAAAAPLTYLLAHSVPVLLVAAVASGFAAAGADLAYVNAAMRFAARDAVAAYAGVFAFLQACRGLPGPFIGAALSQALGPRPVFLVALGLWTASAFLLLLGGALRRTSGQPAPQSASHTTAPV